MGLKTLLSIVMLLVLSGCIEREVYTEIADRSIIDHPPSSVQVEDPRGMLKPDLPINRDAALKLSLYIHCAKCTNAQSKSLGADFDGYIRLTLRKENRTLARAQMDYKGEATPEEVAQVYDHLLKELRWQSSY